MAYSRYGCTCWQCVGADAKGEAKDAHAAGTALYEPPSQPVIAYSYTGDYRIDALLEGLQYRWNAPAPLGGPVTVTYSFMAAKPVYGGTDESGDYGFSPFTAQQKAAVHEILGRLGVELGITFQEVGDFSFSYGQIRFGNNTQSYSAGYAWLPYSTGDDRGGDVWLDNSIAQNLTQLAPGSYAWSTLVHEIGHALGLKHPGDYNAGQTSGPQPGNYLGTLEDNYNYSIMSYRDVAGGQLRDWYGLYDLLALKKLYGAGDLDAGNTVHAFSDSDGTVLKIIDDASGYDTIDLSRLTLNATVDMRPGGFSSIGWNGSVAAINNVTIEFTTLIEKFVGSAHADTVIGNEADNVFVLGQGANSADGDAGIDTAVYAFARAACQIAVSGASGHVTAADLDDTLTHVERLAFADVKLAFDIGDHAGEVAKILGAVFGQGAQPNPQYAGIGLSLLDANVSYAALMDFALDVRLGDIHSYGAVVTLLYTNVMGAPPPDDAYAAYTGLLANGTYSEAGLAIFAADSPQNAARVDLVGLAQTGLVFV